MEQFKIEVAEGDISKFYDIKSLGANHYEVFVEETSIGTIILDEKDHSRCETIGCELDLPLINSIREGIHAFEERKV